MTKILRKALVVFRKRLYPAKFAFYNFSENLSFHLVEKPDESQVTLRLLKLTYAITI